MTPIPPVKLCIISLGHDRAYHTIINFIYIQLNIIYSVIRVKLGHVAIAWSEWFSPAVIMPMLIEANNSIDYRGRKAPSMIIVL